jgi:hypothetical protein
MALGDRPRTRLAGSAVLVFLCAACPLSPARGVPAGEYTVTLNGGAPQTGPGTFVLQGALGEIDLSPSPFAFARVAEQGTSIVQISYWFRVNGPPNAHVPIKIDGRVQLSAGNAVFEQNLIWGVSASMSAQALDGPLGPGVGEIDSDADGVSCNPNSVGPNPLPPPIPSCPATEQDEPVLLSLNVQSGADNRVNLVATANNQAIFSADFDAQVDPVISFAPGFDSTGYSIELSEGVGNTVPEPGAALMTLVGAGVLLCSGRARGTRLPGRCTTLAG